MAGAAVGKYGEAVSEEQEILGRISDIAAEAFAMESGLLRAVKAIEASGEEAVAELKVDMVRVYVDEAMCRVREYAAGCAGSGAQRRRNWPGSGRACPHDAGRALNIIGVRRSIADRVIAAEKYIC